MYHTGVDLKEKRRWRTLIAQVDIHTYQLFGTNPPEFNTSYFTRWRSAIFIFSLFSGLDTFFGIPILATT